MRLQAVVTAAVLLSGVGATLAHGTDTGLPQAGGPLLALVQRAPQRLLDAPSVRLHLTETIHASGRDVTATMDGLVDPRTGSGTLHEVLPAGVGTLDFRAVQNTIYVQVLPAHLADTRGRHWAALTLTGLPSAQQSPDGFLGYLRLLAGADGIQDLGATRVDGVAVRHFRAMLDLAKVIARVPAQLRSPESAGAVAQLKALGVTSMPLDVWIDGQGMPRQEQVHYAIGTAVMELTMSFSPSEQPLRVSRPSVGDTFVVATQQDLFRLALPVGYSPH